MLHKETFYLVGEKAYYMALGQLLIGYQWGG